MPVVDLLLDLVAECQQLPVVGLRSCTIDEKDVQKAELPVPVPGSASSRKKSCNSRAIFSGNLDAGNV